MEYYSPFVFGNRLRILRKKKGFTQRKLGEQFKPAYSTRVISDWERGVSYPGMLAFCALCNILDVTPEDFLKKR